MVVWTIHSAGAGTSHEAPIKLHADISNHSAAVSSHIEKSRVAKGPGLIREGAGLSGTLRYLARFVKQEMAAILFLATIFPALQQVKVINISIDITTLVCNHGRDEAGQQRPQEPPISCRLGKDDVGKISVKFPFKNQLAGNSKEYFPRKFLR
ncbi:MULTISPECIES: hypothetical protein [unclassified Janthinobacterium]|uniref:hypothetical protein n=1 Tax=unclassified Janthinobacterium TaxID=2610881 RepID=UPI001113F655|nr:MULTISPECIES: hypothetical protein [unclassified Janthinobacterium]